MNRLTRRSLAAMSIAVLSALGGCSDGGSGKTSTADSTNGTAATTTEPASIPQPAGLTFALPGTLVAQGSDLDTDGTKWFGLGSTPSTISNCAGGDACGRTAPNPVFMSGPSVDALAATPIDDIAAVPLPAGWTQPNYLIANDLAVGTAGMVAVGTLSVWDSPGFYAGTSRAMLWHSTDGATWQRIDMGPVMGDTLSSLQAVTATDSGFVAVGQVAAADPNAAPSQVAALFSPDGVSWTKVGQLATPWAGTASGVHAIGDKVLVDAFQYACDGGASNMIDFSVGAQAVPWASTDGGRTWTAVDLPTVAPTLVTDRPAIPDAASCSTDLSVRDGLRWTPRVMSGGGLFAMLGTNGSTLATSSDLTTWTVTEVPGMSTGSHDSLLLAADDTGPFVARLGAGVGDAKTLSVWRADASLTAWTALDGVDLFSDTRDGSLTQFADGSFGLYLSDRKATPPTLTLLLATG